MIAVWSLWTKPIRELPVQAWADEYHHLLSWILSVQTARRHFSRTVLVTDDYGARLLVDTLGLEFDSVSTALNQIEKYNAQWWALGKLHTYALQEEPFVHVDADAFLWQQIPQRLTYAPVFCQNFEPLVLPNAFYDVDKFRRLREQGAWIPQEIDWFEASGRVPSAVCCGIFGGNDIEFINHYARSAIRLVQEEPNVMLWERESPDNLLVEQFYLSVCIQCRGLDGGATGAPRAAYLFQDWAEAFDPVAARRVGFTHLIGAAKRNPYLLNLVERRVAADHPFHYEIVKKYHLSARHWLREAYD